jgi:hypothetical protein
MGLTNEDIKRVEKIGQLVQDLYTVMNPFPNHHVHCRGSQGGSLGLDFILARLETLDKDIKKGDVLISFPHDRNQLPQGIQG